jgi:hypothetical protein
MAKKPSITTVSSGYQSTTTINSNTQNLRDAFDNTLSLDGSTPNAMQADLDINSNDILNVNKLYINGLYIDGQPVSAGTLNYNGVIKETQTATSGQTVFNLTTMVYNPGINSLSVYVDGVYQNPSTYTENNSTRITFSAGLHVGAIVDFVALSINEITGGADATTITYTPAGSGAVTTTVSNKLKQTISVKDFGAVGNGMADDTDAFQAAIDSGLPFTVPFADYLITDSLEINPNVGCEIICEARTVANNVAFPRITFQPATKRDVFVWTSLPTSYAFAAVRISGLSLVGAGPGAAAVFNLPRLYRGNIDAYIYTGIDHYAIVERWLDCNVTGNINGFRSSAFRITNSTLSGGNITTRTDFDVYISGGDPAYTTYGYDIETYAIVGGRLTNMVESCECAIRMARGNSIDSAIYTENIPRTNAGALFEIGKINTGTPDGTTVFTHVGVNLHGRNVAAPGYSATLFADIDYCTSFSIIGADIKRFGGLLKTTADSKNISFTDCYTVGVELLELTTTGIADLTELTFSGFRPVGMSSAHGPAFQNTNVMTTVARNPSGTRPRWAFDRIYSTTSLSFWLSTGDDTTDWRLMAPKVYVASLDVATGTINAGASYQVDLTVTGALVGDFAVASYATLLPGLAISARVSATDTVTVTLTNVTGSPISSGGTATIRTLVTKYVLT